MVGLHQGNNDDYVRIILDVMLPSLYGWTVLQIIQRAGNQTPVRCLAACDKVEDRVCCLESGAGAYLVRPFLFAELLARASSTWCGTRSRWSGLMRVLRRWTSDWVTH